MEGPLRAAIKQQVGSHNMQMRVKGELCWLLLSLPGWESATRFCSSFMLGAAPVPLLLQFPSSCGTAPPHARVYLSLADMAEELQALPDYTTSMLSNRVIASALTTAVIVALLMLRLVGGSGPLTA